MPYAGLINPVGAPPPQQDQLQGYAGMNPIQAPQEGPPTTPQELEQRKSGWQDFMTRLQTDPAMRNAALMTATTLMQGQGDGETAGNMLGRGLQAGVISHGFHQANQTRMDLERQKFEQERLLNQAQIAQQQAQTRGLDQTQDFARRDRPMDVQAKQQGLTLGELKNKSGQFEVDNQGRVLEDTLATNAEERVLKRKTGNWYDKKGDAAITNANVGGARTPAGVALFNRHVESFMLQHPQGADEHPLDYRARIEKLVTDYHAKPNAGGAVPASVKVQALREVLLQQDPGTPEFNATLDELKALGSGDPQLAAPGAVISDKGNKGFPTAAYQRANDIAKSAGKKHFVGPDGDTYKVK